MGIFEKKIIQLFDMNSSTTITIQNRNPYQVCMLNIDEACDLNGTRHIVFTRQIVTYGKFLVRRYDTRQ